MGIDLPVSTVTSLLKEQVDWEKKRQKASSKENLHKRYIFLGESANVDSVYTGTYKRRKKRPSMNWKKFIWNLCVMSEM